MTQAAELVAALRQCGLTVAVAESLTGGLLASAFVDVPGASEVFAGGIVAYQTAHKIRQLGVPAEVIERHSVVDARVAVHMALGVRERFGTDIGLSTTGVAGPDAVGDHPVGTVFVGISAHDVTRALPLQLSGSRHAIRIETVDAALSGLVAILGEQI
ncbi:MAG: CinA family protein [Aeromicrobium sp.]|nr:MAG: CinA family protein [Aeromicrobium sp.]